MVSHNLQTLPSGQNWHPPQYACAPLYTGHNAKGRVGDRLVERLEVGLNELVGENEMDGTTVGLMAS